MITNLIHKSSIKKYTLSLSWVFSENILRLLLNFCVGVWLARYLGPQEFGVLSYIIALTSIFFGISKLGIDNVLVRNIVRNPEDKQNFLGTAFWLRFLGSILSYALIAITVLYYESSENVHKLVLIFSCICFFQISEVIEYYYRSQVRGKWIALCKITQILIGSILKIYLIISNSDLIWIVASFVIDSFILAILYVGSFYFLKQPNFINFFKLKTATLLLRSSLPLVFSGIIITAYMRIDQIMLKILISESAVGVYAAAIRISQSLYFIPIVFASSILPAIISNKKSGPVVYERRFFLIYTLIAWIGIIFSVSLSIFSDIIISNLFGIDYTEASSVLKIQAYSLIFIYLGIITDKFLIAEDMTRLIFLRSLIGLILNILLNFILIPELGIQGAAIATIITQFSMTFMFDLFVKELRVHLCMKIKSLAMPWAVIRILKLEAESTR